VDAEPHDDHRDVVLCFEPNDEPAMSELVARLRDIERAAQWDGREYDSSVIHKAAAEIERLQSLALTDYKISQILNAGIAAEREACAKIVEEWPPNVSDDIAAAIRARSSEKPKPEKGIV